MKRLLVVAGLISSSSGCASTAYWSDRKHDAADVFTVTVGYGVGLKVRAGPVQGGVAWSRDRFGVRGGEFAVMTKVDGSEFLLPYPLPSEWGPFFAMEGSSFGTDRRKDYFAASRGLPFVIDHCGGANDSAAGRIHYFSQAEVLVGLGVTLRFGVNPGELLDFVLGWFTVDLLRDDAKSLDHAKAISTDGRTEKPVEIKDSTRTQ